VSLIDRRHRQAGVDGLALENDHVRLTVFPSAGAKILELIHTATGIDLLWQNPRVPLRPTYPGPAFDDVWCGGWDELFPTDPPCTLGENTFQDHGDLWCGPWELAIERDDPEEATVHLARHAVALPCLMEKWITVRRDDPAVGFRHRLTNLGTQRVPFTWSLHVAHRISRASRIHLPAEAVGVVPGWTGRLDEATARVGWPAHDDLDLGGVGSPEDGLTEWLYALGLREGWCAVTHPDAGVGLGLAFDASLFETVWLWGVYGGWRGHYVLLTEPSTSPPGGLAAAVGGGTAAWLEPGQTLETHVTATALTVAESRPADERPAGLWLVS
jgi:hypothetical protein